MGEGSDECTDAGDGASDDERVDIVGALVGVHRLHVGQRGCHPEVVDQPVAAQQLARQGYALAPTQRVERLAVIESKSVTRIRGTSKMDSNRYVHGADHDTNE